MQEQMSGGSKEGWRLRRRAPRRERALRAVVLGRATAAGEIASRLSGGRTAEVLLTRATADVIILWDPDPPAVREIALWAVRSCPYTVLILAARDGLALCREAARASGLPRWLILATGGLPHSAMEARQLARRLDVSVAQVCVPVIGGDAPAGTAALRRYATVAGITADAMGDTGPSDRPLQTPARPASDTSLIGAAVTLARAVIEDRRQVLCCGAWVEGAWGISGGYVIAPVPVGARGAEEPLPISLTVGERALLQRAAIVP